MGFVLRSHISQCIGCIGSLAYLLSISLDSRLICVTWDWLSMYSSWSLRPNLIVYLRLFPFRSSWLNFTRNLLFGDTWGVSSSIPRIAVTCPKCVGVWAFREYDTTCFLAMFFVIPFPRLFAPSWFPATSPVPLSPPPPPIFLSPVFLPPPPPRRLEEIFAIGSPWDPVLFLFRSFPNSSPPVFPFPVLPLFWGSSYNCLSPPPNCTANSSPISRSDYVYYTPTLSSLTAFDAKSS